MSQHQAFIALNCVHSICALSHLFCVSMSKVCHKVTVSLSFQFRKDFVRMLLLDGGHVICLCASHLFSGWWRGRGKSTYGCAKMLQSCPTLCNAMDCSPPGSSLHGILQRRILDWLAMPFQEIFPTQWSNSYLSCSLHLQASSLPLVPPGKLR